MKSIMERTTTSPYKRPSHASPRAPQVLNYMNWRQSRSSRRLAKCPSPDLHDSTNNTSLRTLLADISHLRKRPQCTERTTDKLKLNQTCQNQHMMQSVDCEPTQLSTGCKLTIRNSNGSEKIYRVNLTTVGKLCQYLKQKYHRVDMWQTYPQNIALDYYLTLQDKDISFLNSESLTLSPYCLQKQEVVDLNSFQILHCIGTGGFSKVFLCRFREDGKFYAMKVIDKGFIVKNKKKRIVMNEKTIMEELQHPFIIEMKFSFESNSSLVFVLELCPGGELFGLVKKFRVMSQSVARFYMTEILLGLEQVHKNGIVYRDFKPQNILIDLQGHVRIADFGLAKPGITSTKQKAYSFCGSPEYMPPQMILKKGHSLPVDFYCLGALLYELVTGLPPFYTQDPEEIYQGTISKQVTFPSHVKLSQDLKYLLKGLLCKEQTRRLGSYNGVKEVLAHPWFTKVSKQHYLGKEIESPVKFTGIKDLELIFSEMKLDKNEFLQGILTEQQLQASQMHFQHVMRNFYYDYRTKLQSQQPVASRGENETFSTRINFSLERNTVKSGKSSQKTLRTMLSQRSFTSKLSTRKKPMSSRGHLDFHLYLR